MSSAGLDHSAGAFDAQYSRHMAMQAARFALRESWRLSRFRTIAILVLPVVAGALPAAMALVLRELINAVVESRETSEAAFLVVVSLVLAYVLAMITPLRRTLEQINEEVLEQKLQVKLLEKSDRLDFSYFEDPETRDRIDEAFERPGVATAGLLAQFATFLLSTITLVSLLAVLASIDPYLLIWLLPIGLPYLAHRWWLTRVRFARIRTQRRAKRWATHFTASLIDERRLPETRLLGLGPLFRRRVDEGLGAVVRESRAMFLREMASSLVFSAATLGIIYWSLWQVVQRALEGDVTIGDIAIFAGAVGAVRTSMDQLVLALGRVRWFLLTVATIDTVLGLNDKHPGAVEPVSISSTDANGEQPPPLELRNVTFAYPGASVPAVRDVDLRIERGETVGLVGPNGSGKTTLAKLIAGLYLPAEGQVLCDGRPTSELEREEIRELVSCVFQQYGAYEGTAAENLALGDWERLLDDRHGVAQLARTVGLHKFIEGLPEGYDTQLGKAFGRARLSGGQEQRFAIGRAFARDVPIMLLDEPTANLDADTEYEVFELFRDLAQDRATLLISHRFSTLALADRILVLEDGVVVERGSHEELLQQAGLYRRMYDRARFER